MLARSKNHENTKKSSKFGHIIMSLAIHAAFFARLQIAPKFEHTPIEVRFETSVENKNQINPPKSKNRENKVYPNSPKPSNKVLFGHSGALYDRLRTLKESSHNETDGEKILADEKLIYGIFFDRVRSRLDSEWQGSVRVLIAKYYTSIGVRLTGQITRVMVTLDANGRLIGVRVMSASADSKLDALALEAFNNSAIFPNPPKDLIKDGKITFDWHFVIY